MCIFDTWISGRNTNYLYLPLLTDQYSRYKDLLKCPPSSRYLEDSWEMEEVCSY